MIRQKTLFPKTIAIVWVTLLSQSAFSQGDLTNQQPVEVKIQLGNEQDLPRFFPDSLKFETGKLYRLLIHNAGKSKHYFSSDTLAQSVYTRKVQIADAGGNTLVEVKGSIREIEVYPGNTAEWWFVPLKAGKFDDLKCVIPGHAQAGMVGNISID